MGSAMMQLIDTNYVINDKTDNKEKGSRHYSSKQKILLVGEGDFSFAACLAIAFEDASSMVATSLDSQGSLEAKYANAKKNLEILKEKGCVLLHEVDAHTMSKLPVLRNQQFDRIVFNFPHAHLHFREHDASQIILHQELVRGFFKSAYKLLAKNGEIHVTHKTSHPFDRWNIEWLASEAGLYLVGKVRFYQYDYHGYSNKKGEGHGVNCDQSFPIGECYTFKFAKLDTAELQHCVRPLRALLRISEDSQSRRDMSR